MPIRNDRTSLYEPLSSVIVDNTQLLQNVILIAGNPIRGHCFEIERIYHETFVFFDLCSSNGKRRMSIWQPLLIFAAGTQWTCPWWLTVAKYRFRSNNGLL